MYTETYLHGHCLQAVDHRAGLRGEIGHEVLRAAGGPVYICECMCMCVCISMFICMYVGMYVCIYMYMCIYTG
jgi:hypothetical protein